MNHIKSFGKEAQKSKKLKKTENTKNEGSAKRAF